MSAIEKSQRENCTTFHDNRNRRRSRRKKAHTVCIIQRTEGKNIDSARACVKHNPSCAIKARRMKFAFVNFTSLNHSTANAKRLVGYFVYLLDSFSLCRSVTRSLVRSLTLRFYGLTIKVFYRFFVWRMAKLSIHRAKQLTMKTLKM